MAYSPPHDLQGRVRLRFQGINVQPATSPKGAVRIKLFFDDVEAYSSPYVKRGNSLQWEVPISCDVFPNTRIGVQIMEKRGLRDAQILETLDGFASDMIKADIARFAKVSDNQRSTVTFTLATEDKISEMFTSAQKWVEQIQTLNQTPAAYSAIHRSFERILSVVNSSIESHPYARSAYTQTVMAWKVLRKQGTRQHVLDFIVSFASLLPGSETIEIASIQPELNSTVTSMLHMIEDLTRLVIKTIGESTSIFWTDSEASLSFWGESDSLLEKMSRVKTQLGARMESCTLTHYSKAEALLLRSLQTERYAHYDPGKTCMPGTRNKAIGDIKSWCLAQGGIPGILWLCGQFGIGKTAIAASVCQELVQEADNVLAASFFCQRGDPRLSNPEYILKAVLFGLSARFPALGEHVIDALRQKEEESESSDDEQVTRLMDRINGSLKNLDRSGVLVVIIDAVDECGTDDTREQLIAHLWSMCQHAQWLRVFLNGRNKPNVARRLDPTTSKAFFVYNLEPDETSSDISIYCRTMLNNIAVTEEWAERELEQLCEHAGGLFLWASAACKYIIAGSNHTGRLRRLDDYSSETDPPHPLDDLYISVMERLLGFGRPQDVAQAMAAIVISSSCGPILPAALSGITRKNVSSQLLRDISNSLGLAIDSSSTESEAICVGHSSLSLFLADPLRSGPFSVDMAQARQNMVQGCLDVMAKQLRFNICGLDTSHSLNREVLDLGERVSAAITPELAFSCTYWVQLACEGASFSLGRQMAVAVQDFLMGPTLLYWIEVLSLLGRLEHAPGALIKLASLISSKLQYASVDSNAIAEPGYNANNMVLCIMDAYRFVTTFYEPISQSTPHLYVSAFALAPKASLISSRLEHHFPNTAGVHQGEISCWSSIMHDMPQPSPVSSLAASPDGVTVVAGYEDGSLRLWDSISGVYVQEVTESHSNSVTCISFAPSGYSFVTGSHDGTLMVWDSKARAILNRPLSGHSSGVTCVAHSPDGGHVVSGSHDGSLLLWDAKKWALFGKPLRDHSSAVSSVAFCPTGRRIASGSWDKTVRIWDVGSKNITSERLEGHLLSVSAVVFSPDGRLLASGSWDETIKIWNLASGSLVHSFAMGRSKGVSCLSFSSDNQRVASGSYNNGISVWDLKSKTIALRPNPEQNRCTTSVVYTLDGKRLISASSDRTVRVWDTTRASNDEEETPHVLPHTINAIHNNMTQNKPDAIGKTLTGHSSYVMSVAFSPDGRRIVSGSLDETLRMWDAETGAALGKPLTGHSNTVRSVAFSPDGRRVVSGSYDNTLRMWDAETGAALGKPFTGHSNWVRSVAFSPDGRRIVSGSSDKTLQTWDAETGVALGNSLTGHSETVWSVAFSPDGRRIVSGSWDKTLRMWDAETGAALGQPLTGHYSYVLSVAFSPDGRRVVSGSADSTLRIWDVSSSSLHSLPASSLVQKTEDNGWVVGIEGTHLLWLPAEYRQHTPTYLSSNTRTQRRDVLLDLSRFKHGDSWAEVVGEASKMS